MAEYKSKILGFETHIDDGGKIARIVKLEMPESFSFEPGQFVMMAAPKIMNRVHPEQHKWASMSIASTPLDKGYIELGMGEGEQGGVRHFVCRHAKVGDELLVKGPFGRFVLSGKEQEIVLVALGTGITPLAGMARTLLRQNSLAPITLFYSIKNSRHYLFGKELEKLASAHPNFSLFVTVTREDNEWKGKKGRLQGHFRSFDFGEKHRKSFFICGSPRAVIEIIEALKGIGVTEEQIKKEQW